jgi:TolA-binding protein
MKFFLKSTMLMCFLLITGCSSLWPFGGSKKEEQEAVSGAKNAPGEVGSTKAPLNAPVEQRTSANSSTSSDELKNNVDSNQSPRSPNAMDARPSSVNSASYSDQLLDQARIMARLDGLEGELKRQREKIKLLEQGLLTGIAPDDLKRQKFNKSEKSIGEANRKKGDAELPKPDLADVAIPSSKQSSTSDADSAINAKFQLAKEHYQASRFGMAVAELAGISRDYGPKTLDGAVKVWLGKSYLSMKEYSTARSEFEFYIKEWPTGSHVAEARLSLAKALHGMGLRERAQSELKRVMKDFDGQEYSEIASAELQKIQGNL